ncbi:MFS transporter [Hydrogenophaga sp.]|uniref:MFS transporter n=1 Tax=Hydrogenophaga sp. TaxID=1904254 RepID=UPI0035661761
MSCIPISNELAGQAQVVARAEPDLPSALVLVLATGAGLGVAALYYSQPMLGVLAADIGASTSAIGWLPTLVQLGYALGILFLAPLGDRYDRRQIILGKAVALTLALLLSGMAPSLWALLVTGLFTGLSASLAQDIVPAAATVAPAAHRGRTVGTVMTGLFLGILLSRAVSGLVAEQFGWRAMFFAAATSIALIGVALWRHLPRFVPTTQLAYGALLASLGQLWLRHAVLRRAALAQGLLSVGFSAFWSTLALMLHGAPIHLGSAAAGAIGLAGAAGALAAPLAGRFSDRHGPERVIALGTGLAVFSFAAMVFLPGLSAPAGLCLLVVCAVGFDLGAQVSLVAHQTLVYGIDPAARSRLNTVLFVGMFTGMALGSALGNLLLARWGWMGVTALATGTAVAALLVRLWPSSARTV